MNLVLKTFTTTFIAMLVLVGAAFFVLPVQNEVQAQSSAPRSFCFNSSSREFLIPAKTGACPSGWEIVVAPRARGFCIYSVSGKMTAKYFDEDEWTLNATGTKCVAFNENTGANEEFADYKSMASITQQYNPEGNNTNQTNNTPNNSPGNTPNTKVNTNPKTNSGDSSTGTGGCDLGFHKVGPLCVPDSPFNNGSSITKEPTLGGVATRIIQILLYFAAIVAVIMAIVGGYQVMTAAGNEQQAVNGRKTLINAIIGLVIVILSYMIIQVVIGFVTKG